jgi:small basic protein
MKLERVERLNLGLSAGAVAASFVLATPNFAISLAAGAALEAVNFGALHRGAQRFFSGDVPGASGWLILFALRFVMLGVSIGVVIWVGAHPVALVIGLSIAMPAVLIDAWMNRPQPTDEAAMPGLAPDDPEWDRHSVWAVDSLDRDDDLDWEEEEDKRALLRTLGELRETKRDEDN